MGVFSGISLCISLCISRVFLGGISRGYFLGTAKVSLWVFHSLFLRYFSRYLPGISWDISRIFLKVFLGHFSGYFSGITWGYLVQSQHSLLCLVNHHHQLLVIPKK